MKREIKFRGKRVDNGEWVEGRLISVYSMMSDDGPCDAIQAKSCDGKICKSIVVDHETVGQFTGAEGRYEGDIIDDGDGEPVVIEFSEKRFKFIVTELYNGEYADDLDGWEKLPLIGNIHDNPELIG